MKVLTLTTLYPNTCQPLQGVFVHERIRHLARLCDVQVVAPVLLPPAKEGHLDGKDRKWNDVLKVAKRELCDNVIVYHPRIYYLPKFDVHVRWINYFLFLYFSLRKIRKTYKFDIIDAHWAYPDGMAAVCLGKCYNVPVMVSCRGTDVNLYPDLPIFRSLVKFTLNNCDAIVAVSRSLKDRITSLGIPNNKTRVIANGVDSEKFHFIARKYARNMFHLPGDKKVILSIGHLVERKGFHFLIDAMNILVNKKNYRNVLLIIVGEGNYRKRLEHLIHEYSLENHVNLVGAKSFNEVPMWHNIADVFALASSREGWPNVLFEALASGSPIVATKAWGNSEVICSEDYGILVDNQSGDELAIAFEIALKKKWNRKKIIEYAQDNSWEEVGGKVFSYISETLVDWEKK